MRLPLFVLLSVFVMAAPVGCAVDDDLVDTTGGGDSGADGVSLDANPPDTTTVVPDTEVADTGVAPDTARDSTADTTVPDTFILPDTVGFDLATIDTAVLDSFVGPTCTTAADCPGADLECAKRACVGGRCTVAFVAASTPVALQVPFDCKRNECSGAGLVRNVYDPTDQPNDDNECTIDSCPTATPVFTPRPAGALCSKGGRMCDGVGRCVACISPSDCPTPAGACSSATCTAGICGVGTAPAGTLFGPQTPGDCESTVCDGAGSTRTIYDTADPNSDGNDCTEDLCRDNDGIYTTHPTKPAGSVCNGTMTCRLIELDGPSYTKTVCGECDQPNDCYRTKPTTTYGPCEVPTCTNHTCGKGNELPGTSCFNGSECRAACNATGSCLCGVE